ncbi:hypothetical protein CTI12_AA452190 [Artemisia annua]|uniref:Uncharacterized protein n=1 Tax=Artemisia annua TaxID=35608 RepID=A0A2U1LUW8_ARTAN|nr:hypothetical protein CTI12_AA452190 [Artemisia annua]
MVLLDHRPFMIPSCHFVPRIFVSDNPKLSGGFLSACQLYDNDYSYNRVGTSGEGPSQFFTLWFEIPEVFALARGRVTPLSAVAQFVFLPWVLSLPLWFWGCGNGDDCCSDELLHNYPTTTWMQ